MHRVLLGAAASIAALTVASPASAQGAAAATGFSAMSGSRSFGGVRAVPANSRSGDLRRGHSRHFRHIHVPDNFAAAGFGYSGYNDYGDYDANRSFDPDKWNDWWHERPERSFPRWVWNNQNCTLDRMWYSGSGWRCTP